MPYDRNTGLMTEPLNTYDVARATGMSPQSDIGSMITKGSINKWAKNKPIRYNKYSDLTGDERKGMTADVSNGYYYGVKLGSKSGQGGDILGLHDVTFEYLRPTGYYRMTDFVGYSKSAKANVFCDLPDSAANDVEKGMYFDIEYRSGNSDGIDVSEAVISATGAGITSCYPCLLLSSMDRSANYCCVLRKDSDGSAGTITERNRIYYADLRAVVNGTTKLPAGNYIITPFLYRSKSSEPFVTSGAWFTVSSGQIWTSIPMVIPNNYAGDAGKVITVSESDKRPIMTIESVAVSGSTLTITAHTVGEYDNTKATWCLCSPTIVDANGGVRTPQGSSKKITEFGVALFTFDLSLEGIMKGNPAVTYSLSCVFSTYYSGQHPSVGKSSFGSTTFNY